MPSIDSSQAAPAGDLDAAALVEQLMFPDSAPAADAATAVSGDAPAAAVHPLVAPALPDTPEPQAPAPEPAAPAATDNTPQGVDESQLNASNAVIASKNGQYTIGYEKLEQARTRAQTAEAQLAQLQQELQQLREQQAAGGGQAPSAELEAAVKDALSLGEEVDLGDYTEDDLKKAFLAERTRNAAAIEQLTKHIQTLAEPIRSQAEVQTRKEHNEVILQAHADAYEIAQSLELKQWVESKPAYMRPALQQVLAQGQAADVVQLLSDFKSETGRTAPPPAAKDSAVDARAKAEALLNATPVTVPNSLSQIAGSSQGAASVFEAMENMDAADLAERLAAMTPDQREVYYARNAY